MEAERLKDIMHIQQWEDTMANHATRKQIRIQMKFIRMKKDIGPVAKENAILHLQFALLRKQLQENGASVDVVLESMFGKDQASLSEDDKIRFVTLACDDFLCRNENAIEDGNLWPWQRNTINHMVKRVLDKWDYLHGLSIFDESWGENINVFTESVPVA